MAVTCKRCGGGHPTWDCPYNDEQAAKKLASARKIDDAIVSGRLPATPELGPPDRPYKKSTAARKDVLGKQTVGLVSALPLSEPGKRNPDRSRGRREQHSDATAAGTQAPPVDTYPRIEGAKFVATVPEGTQLLSYGNRVLAAGPGLAPSIVTSKGLVALTVPVGDLKKGGRPKTVEDRQAYKRDKEQKRRDRIKKEKSNGDQSTD
jgi:hypothetical protein